MLEVQQGLLPPAELKIAGWNMAYCYRPVGPVSGDYCDVLPLEGGAALFMLGDVSGKGVAASMLMAQLHAIFRSLSLATASVTELVGKANRIFCQGNPTCHFATLVCGHLDGQGNVEMCNAGHCLPLWVSEGEVKHIESTGLPVGVLRRRISLAQPKTGSGRQPGPLHRRLIGGVQSCPGALRSQATGRTRGTSRGAFAQSAVGGDPAGPRGFSSGPRAVR